MLRRLKVVYVLTYVKFISSRYFSRKCGTEGLEILALRSQ